MSTTFTGYPKKERQTKLNLYSLFLGTISINSLDLMIQILTKQVGGKVHSAIALFGKKLKQNLKIIVFLS